MCAAPYYVASKMSKIRHSSWTIPSPDNYAASVLSQVTLDQRKYTKIRNIYAMIFKVILKVDL